MRHHPLAECEECPLFDVGHYVPSTGPEQADLVLVGEAPGATEVETGEPFTGTSGRLLDSLLTPAGIDRRKAFVTNSCLCRPPGNATPTAKAIKACRPRLIDEIKSRKPKTILGLGAVASKNLLETTSGLTRLRLGPPKSSPSLPGVKVVPTYHPAAALYNSDVLPDIITDFKKLTGEVGSDWRPPAYKVLDERCLVIPVLEEMYENGKPVAIDIEVGIDKDTGFVTPRNPNLLCVGLSQDPNLVYIIGKNACRAMGWGVAFSKMLSRCPIIAHNGKFDLTGLGYGKSSPANTAELWFDTMLASYALDERKGTNSLQYLSIELLGSPDWKSEIDEYVGHGKGYDNIPDQMLYKYNAYDVANTFRLYEVLSAQLEQYPELKRLHEFLLRSSQTLMEMEWNGLTVDVSYLDQLGRKLISKLEDMKHELRSAVLNSYYNPNSPVQVKKVILDIFGVVVEDTRAETIRSLQATAARRGQHDLFDFCEKHLEFKRLAKQSGTYVKGIRERIVGDKVYTSFLLHGTVTGRLSSRNPNLQNIPRDNDIKREFVPHDEHNHLVQADYQQAELRVVAWLAKDEYLRGVLSDPERDIHGEVAAQIFGSDFTKEQRVKAKAVVFGVTYGMEAPYLSAMLKITPGEARKYIDGWFEMIPDTARWIRELEQSVLDTGRIQSPLFGHTRRFWHISNSNRKDVLKEARAFLPQNIASNICLEAANRLRENHFGPALRILVHDAIIFEWNDPRDKWVSKAKQIMEDTGFEILEGYLPTPVDMAYGKSWGTLHDL